MKSPTGNIPEHGETWKTLALSRDILELMMLAYLPLCVPSESDIPSCHAGSWRQLEIGMLR